MDLNILRKEIKQKRLSLDYQKFELYNLEINNTIIVAGAIALQYLPQPTG